MALLGGATRLAEPAPAASREGGGREKSEPPSEAGCPSYTRGKRLDGAYL